MAQLTGVASHTPPLEPKENSGLEWALNTNLSLTSPNLDLHFNRKLQKDRIYLLFLIICSKVVIEIVPAVENKVWVRKKGPHNVIYLRVQEPLIHGLSKLIRKDTKWGVVWYYCGLKGQVVQLCWSQGWGGKTRKGTHNTEATERNLRLMDTSEQTYKDMVTILPLPLVPCLLLDFVIATWHRINTNMVVLKKVYLYDTVVSL